MGDGVSIFLKNGEIKLTHDFGRKPTIDLIDSEGVTHLEVSITKDRGLGHIEDQTINYDGGLSHYYVDGREVTKAEFYRLFPQLQDFDEA